MRLRTTRHVLISIARWAGFFAIPLTFSALGCSGASVQNLMFGDGADGGSGGGSSGGSGGSSGGSSSGGSGSSGGSAGSGASSGGGASGIDSGEINDSSIADSTLGVSSDIPATCAEAAATKSHIGCEYWPTVIANNVWSIFDFAVVVANAGTSSASITVTGPNAFSQTVNVSAQSEAKIYLPWVAELKGADTDSCGDVVPFPASVLSHGGAYHLTSSVPVSVYQFNALEYKGAGGPPGKNWSSCPGNSICASDEVAIGCFSYSNDASLLLPTTSLTGNYRVMGEHGWSEVTAGTTETALVGATLAITATEDNTTLAIQISSTGNVIAGGSIAATSANGIVNLMLNAGDVAELVGALGKATDLSGSLVNANKPVQVITGVPCINQPEGAPACDHIESSVFPAEALGKHYVVTVPTAPAGGAIGHVVRFFGNVNGTNLTFSPSMPAGCAATINAGQVIDCAVVSTNFEVTGDHEFGVGSFMLGGSLLDPTNTTDPDGDPSQSMCVPVEQYRNSYSFPAPNDYDSSYVDIITPLGNSITLDGQPVSTQVTNVSSAYGVIRQKLTNVDASHLLVASQPVSIQVIGYGEGTSYQYPGGLNLRAIATAPMIGK
jgi:hypothetical protein